MLLVFISHLLLNKLRRKFSLKKDAIAPGPLLRAPVGLKEYREAIIQYANGQPMTHPDVVTVVEAPSPILTIGLILKNPPALFAHIDELLWRSQMSVKIDGRYVKILHGSII